MNPPGFRARKKAGRARLLPSYTPAHLVLPMISERSTAGGRRVREAHEQPDILPQPAVGALECSKLARISEGEQV